LRELDEHGVRFVVIGGLAAALHGSSQVTFDIDIVPDSDFQNLARLSDALTALEARVRASDTAGGLAFLSQASAAQHSDPTLPLMLGAGASGFAHSVRSVLGRFGSLVGDLPGVSQVLHRLLSGPLAVLEAFLALVFVALSLRAPFLVPIVLAI